MILAHYDCAGYIRVSSDKQATPDKCSPNDQRTAIRALAAELNRVVRIWFRDDFSGKTVKDRPGLSALIDACTLSPRSRRNPGYVLALNDSRWGRFPDPALETAVRWTLKEAGWIVRFAEMDDTRDPAMRHLIRAACAAQASEYRRNVVMNARRGRQGSAKRGWWNARAPYGYRRIVVYPERGRILPVGRAQVA